jgi:hypothetical protein
VSLSHQQLTDVLRWFESTPEADDVRKTPRVSIRRHVTIVIDPQSDTGTRAVVLQDISRGGVRLTYHEAFARGSKFQLMLPNPDGRQVLLPCVVQHCEMVKQHLFRIGAQFESTDAPSQ